MLGRLFKNKKSQAVKSDFSSLIELTAQEHLDFEAVIDNLNKVLTNKDGTENTRGWYKFIALLLSKLSDNMVVSTVILSNKENEKRQL